MNDPAEEKAQARSGVRALEGGGEKRTKRVAKTQVAHLAPISAKRYHPLLCHLFLKRKKQLAEPPPIVDKM
jgi:hypothetical protein